MFLLKSLVYNCLKLFWVLGDTEQLFVQWGQLSELLGFGIPSAL